MVFHATNGAVFPDWLNQAVTFTFQVFFFGKNQRRTEFLLALELLAYSQVETDDLLGKLDEITFVSVFFTFVDI